MKQARPGGVGDRAVGADQQRGLPVGVAGPDHPGDAADRAAVVPWADQLPVRGDQVVDDAGELHPGGGEHDQVVADPFQVGQQVRGEQHGRLRLGDATHQ
ncbi:hypothetical protein ACPFP2_13135 [Micromonospora citrea]|uniref:hypothetical protein n=1 Tax=Micromonospora citrea TaxID=47855 RepID=UPI003C4E3AE9